MAEEARTRQIGSVAASPLRHSARHRASLRRQHAGWTSGMFWVCRSLAEEVTPMADQHEFGRSAGRIVDYPWSLRRVPGTGR